MAADSLLVAARGPVVLLTLNRPEKLNALDYPLIDQRSAGDRGELLRPHGRDARHRGRHFRLADAARAAF